MSYISNALTPTLVIFNNRVSDELIYLLMVFQNTQSYSNVAVTWIFADKHCIDNMMMEMFPIRNTYIATLLIHTYIHTVQINEHILVSLN